VQLQWLAPLPAGMLAVAAGALGGLLWLRGGRGGAPALWAAPAPGGWRVLGGRDWMKARLLAVRQGPLWLRLELGLDAEAGSRVVARRGLVGDGGGGGGGEEWGGVMSDRDVDAELVARVQRGDKKAFDLLVLKYQRKILRLLARMIRDPAEIEDVAQEAFIKA